MIEIDGNILVETEHLGSNNSIICTPEGNVLIDSPHRPTDAMRWRRIVESCGQTRYLINTDHHIDHTMGNTFLPGTVVSHRITRERLLNPPTLEYIHDLLDTIDPEGKAFLDGYQHRVPSITYETEMTLELGGLTFELSFLPGHTPNNTLIYVPQQQVVFTGDLVCELGMPAFIEADVFVWIEAVKKIEAMDIRYLVPGHGKVCGIPEARAFRQMMEDLVGTVSGAIDRGWARDQVVKDIAYEDRIHIETGGSPSYPAHLINTFMEGSIAKIHDQILDKRALAA